MSQTSRHDTSVRYGSRYGSPDATDDQGSTDGRGSRSCPACQATLISRRARYCSAACKQRAYRVRQTDTSPLDLDALPAALRAHQALVTRTVYECPSCEARFLGDQRCPDCHVFCRRLGLGGLCPHCDDPVTLADLLGMEEVQP